MLTADLVDARRKDGELLLRDLDDEGRKEARELGAAYLETARAFVGKRREELVEAWTALDTDTSPKRFKVAQGLKKLAFDACTFEAESPIEPAEIRRVLFTHASESRRTRGEGEPFDREAILGEAATILGTTPEAIERGLFADLKSEHLLRVAPGLDADSLVEAWELGQAQAVLLAAVRVTCEISASSPGLVRAFFAKLKFHQLLFSAERFADSEGSPAWRVVIDGPYSMFDAVTKYGLRLALVLPALRAVEHWSLVADIRWGKERESLVFRLASDLPNAKPAGTSDELHIADDVHELADAINASKSGWRAKSATEILDVPGQGVCIPDLELTRTRGKKTDRPVYVEVLGYWSRDAVFRRVELAEKGLGVRIIFAVSSRLRVSAEVLDEKLDASLYVYKGKMSPRAVLAHADLVRAKPATSPRSRAGAKAGRTEG